MTDWRIYIDLQFIQADGKGTRMISKEALVASISLSAF
jgi:hypothetical protein